MSAGTGIPAGDRRRPGRWRRGIPALAAGRVAGRRIQAAWHRGGPRLARGVAGAVGVLVGLVLAGLVAGVIAARVGLRAWVSHPRWARVTGLVAGWLCRRRVLAAAAALIGLGVVAWGPDPLPGAALTTVGLVPWVVRGARLVYRHLITRGRLRTGHGVEGWASWWELHRHVSPRAVRRAAVAVRPGLLAHLPNPHQPDVGAGARLARRARRAWATEHLPVSGCGLALGRSVIGPVLGTGCYVAHKDTLGLIAPPQSFKSAVIGSHIIDFPGAVVSVSTKPDHYGHTAALRAARAASGRVELWDLEDLTRRGSTFRWSPVTGCADPATATETAAALVGATAAAGGEDGRFWLDAAARVLRCLLLAADLDGLGMPEVAGWVAAPAACAPEALRLLEFVHPARVPQGWASELRQVLHTDAKRTRESIFLTLAQATAFMADPVAAAAATPAPGEPAFSVAALLAERGTVYVVGTHREHAPLAPLMAAFTSHVFYTAQHLAGPGRLDPGLHLSLDEVALTTPVPLDAWLPDAGGRGISIGWAAQSPSQLAARWGEHGAETIWNATTVKLIGGGLTWAADLEAISRLCGHRPEPLPHQHADPDGPQRGERVPVLSVDGLRTLPPWRALLLARTMPPTVVKLTPVWHRRDLRRGGPPPPVPPTGDTIGQDADQPAAEPGRTHTPGKGAGDAR